MSYSTPSGEGTANQELKTSQVKSEEAIRQRFKVYDCIEIGTQERAKIYKIFFVSEEYLFNSKMKISKGYKGVKVIVNMDRSIRRSTMSRHPSYIEVILKGYIGVKRIFISVFCIKVKEENRSLSPDAVT